MALTDSITAADLAKLRRCIDEPIPAVYDDDTLKDYLVRYPLMDERGVSPYYYNTAVQPPVQVAVSGWYATWDINACAAELWLEKASAVAEDFNYPNYVGGQYDQSRVYDSYMRSARRYASRAAATTIHAIPWPSANQYGGDSAVVNGPDSIDFG